MIFHFLFLQLSDGDGNEKKKQKYHVLKFDKQRKKTERNEEDL